MTNINLNAEWDYYYPKVYGYFFRRVENRLDVEDLASTTLFQFFKSISDPDKSTKITNKHAYLWKIAQNQLVAFIRNKSKQPITIGLKEHFDEAPEPEESFISSHFRERIDHLMRCVQKCLKGIDFEIVKFSLIEQRKSAEVSTILKLTSDNVRKRLSRAVKKLRLKCRSIWEN